MGILNRNQLPAGNQSLLGGGPVQSPVPAGLFDYDPRGGLEKAHAAWRKMAAPVADDTVLGDFKKVLGLLSPYELARTTAEFAFDLAEGAARLPRTGKPLVGDYINLGILAAPAAMRPALKKVVKPLVKKLRAAKPEIVPRAPAVLRGREPLKKDLDPHGIGQVRLDKPYTDIDFTRVPNQEMVPRRTFSPEEFYRENKGGVLIPGVGDKSIGGELLKQVEGIPVNTQLWGGTRFQRTPGGVWASENPQTQSMSNQITAAQRKFDTDNIIMSHSTMGPHAIDFSHHVTDTVLDMVPQLPISRAGAKAIKDRMARGISESTASGYKLFAYPDFPGIRSPKLREWFNKSGNRRKHFVKMMDSKAMREAGMPSIGAVRMATTDARQLGVPWLSGGRDMSRVQPGILTNPRNPHPSFPAETPGTYLGGFRDYASPQSLWPSWWRGPGATKQNPRTSFQKSGGERSQLIDEQWLEQFVRANPNL